MPKLQATRRTRTKPVGKNESWELRSRSKRRSREKNMGTTRGLKGAGTESEGPGVSDRPPALGEVVRRGEKPKGIGIPEQSGREWAKGARGGSATN